MEKFKFISKEKISRLPKVPGVYCFKKGKEILYIGKAANLRERVKNHFQQPSYKDYLFLDKVEKVGYIKTNSEIEALILEAELIKKIQPKFNVIWKDSKNYFFVAKTKEEFPRIFWCHQKKLDVRSLKLEVEYVGPFVDGKALKETLKILRKVFPFRSCRVLSKRPCLWYHLGRCPAPCLLNSKWGPAEGWEGGGRVGVQIPNSKTFKEKIKKECQRNAENVFKIIQGKKKEVLKELKREMKKAAKKEEFEEAAKIRDQILALEKVLEHSRILEKEIRVEVPWKEIEEKLKKNLKVDKVSRIEAFDVSQIHGNFAVGSMVTFINGVPEKNFYRRFKIKFTKKPSDVDMIREILERRFKHKEWGLPDLILIDGGRAQLNAAINSKFQIPNSKQIKVLALAKGERKLYIEGEKKPIFLKNLPREIFNLILNLDNEAHRFAISYHKKLREKGLIPKI
jgi:excinuclease ABC subunit C